MTVRILTGDCVKRLREMDEQSVQCCVTSPPYFGLRDYGSEGQIGLEETPAVYIDKLVSVFREVGRVLRDDGTVWLNIGDSYAANQSNNGGYSGKSTLAGFTSANTKGRRANQSGTTKRFRPDTKPKDLLMIPARVALALQADGWYLRSDIIWCKPNPMPESVTDRPTSAHEHVFLLTKSPRYFYDAEAVREEATPQSIARIQQSTFQQQTGGDKDYRHGVNPNRSMRKTLENFAANPGRNLRNVWEITSQPYPGVHFAVFPPALSERCIKAGSREGDTVLDPFGGAGTTGLVADRLGRNALLIELWADYAEQARSRIAAEAGMFASVEVAW